MDLNIIGKKFDKIKQIEEQINYFYEPRYKKKDNFWKRHFFYDELRKDFSDEITSFGFSPFIQKPFFEQKKDKNIMKYKKEHFEFGLINYIQRIYKDHNNNNNKDIENKISKSLLLNNHNNNNLDNNKNISTNNSDYNLFLGKAFHKIDENKNNQIKRRNIINNKNLSKNNSQNYGNTTNINFYELKSKINDKKEIKTIFNYQNILKKKSHSNKKSEKNISKLLKNNTFNLSNKKKEKENKEDDKNKNQKEINEKIKETMINRYKSLKKNNYKRNIQLIKPKKKEEDSILEIFKKSYSSMNAHLKSFDLNLTKRNNISNIKTPNSKKSKFLESLEKNKRSIFKKAILRKIKNQFDKDYYIQEAKNFKKYDIKINNYNI